jgi:hypothetical protein
VTGPLPLLAAPAIPTNNRPKIRALIRDTHRFVVFHYDHSDEATTLYDRVISSPLITLSVRHIGGVRVSYVTKEGWDLITSVANGILRVFEKRHTPVTKRTREELIEEIERKLELFLADQEVSDERKAEVVRELLAIAFEEM